MTTRLIFRPDAAAHSAKNAHTAPGSTIHPQDRTEDAQMVATPQVERTAADQPAEPTTYTYTPRELNRLVSREISGRLLELADILARNAAFLLANDQVPAEVKRTRALTYLDVADQLRSVGLDEVIRATLSEVAR
ncbi:hypothetical protein VSH64_40590 [Amycolatopsis rhabdoformis]|uniref:Uncharacterized protein n=1 Tax=Amycolatopsis rhabdoformis TaxID=1448059 RepID=A0ABZ1I3R9_9PSEU|nr:hypothetical protein [Amycolatopsis rhabdoformis]WSE29054.1 hypothetical protein VSH64_40590 [Amycolatopsis rhabdoformis]